MVGPALISIVLLGAGCGGDQATSGGGEASTPPLTARAGAPIAIGGTPVGIAADETGVWVVDNSRGELLQLDPAHPTAKPRRIPIRGGPSSVAIGEGAVWVASGDGSITRVDPESGKSRRLDLRITQPGGIAAGEGSVWVTSSAADAVVRIDPVSGRTAGRPIDVGQFPTDVAVGDGSVWVANTRDGSVSSIDPASGEAAEPISVAAEEVLALAVGEGGVWVAKSDERLADEIAVAQIDPSTASVIGETSAVGAAVPVRVAAGEGGVWTTLIGGEVAADTPRDPAVRVIDPASGQIVGKPIPVGERPSAIATGAGAIWVANAGDGTVTRIRAGG